MPTVKFVNEKKSVEVPEGANLRKEALKAGIQLYPFPHNYGNCLGFGACGSCKVVIKSGADHISKPSWWERLRLKTGPISFFMRLTYGDQLRLACRTQVYGDVDVETKPPMNWHGERYWG